MKRVIIIVFAMMVFSCGKDSERDFNYPLLSLFEASRSLDGQRVKVTGYFGYWDEDIPVLYATFSDYEKVDGLYKSHIIYSQQEGSQKAERSDEGKICTFEAKIWYRYSVPTLDNAILVNCGG